MILSLGIEVERSRVATFVMQFDTFAVIMTLVVGAVQLFFSNGIMVCSLTFYDN
jgi:hypothetical protein